MATKYISISLVGSFGILYVCDHYIASKQIFKGNYNYNPQELHRDQASPRNHQASVCNNHLNFIVKSSES